ncbi:hypothetical protein SFC07_04410 [Corynebacterium callunae]|uniref:hypothetical protein n=1 Tax=Corynebacterium callunae TaxID=1721 RepID=UPI003982AE92
MQGKALERHIGAGDHIHVDLTAPLSGMFFPLLEFIAITGVCWMGIGFLDQLPGIDGTTPAASFPDGTRDLLLGIWVALSAWRFGLPLLRQSRFRVIVTDRKLLVRREGLRTKYDSIPLSYINRIQRKRNNLVLAVGGHPRPYVINKLPRAKKVEAVLKDLQYY